MTLSGLLIYRMAPVHAAIISLLIGVVYSKQVFIEDFRSVVFDPKSISIEYSVVNRTYLNINLTIYKVHNVKVLCGIRIKKIVDKKLKTVVSWSDLDLCKFFNSFENNIFFGVFKRIFTATYLKSCPIKEGFYYIKEAYIDANVVGLILTPDVYFIRLDASLLYDGITKLMTTHMRIKLT